MAGVKFLKSAVLPQDYPEPIRPEIALVGRSNAGKSSLLNSMCGGTKAAKISSTPGKTRLINFFDVGEHYRLVDLPGYGYAARDFKEREMWAQMIQDYFEIRLCLLGLILICDIRRTWTQDEQNILEMAKKKRLNAVCVLTKSDKVNQGETLKQLTAWQTESGLPKEFFRPISSLYETGVRELENFIFKSWIKK